MYCLAVCNANYQFTLVDVGDSGRQSDGSVYANSHLGYAIENGNLNIPKPEKLPNSNKTSPFVFAADDAFGLKPNMMKPYPLQNLPLQERIFNYRLSRARRVIENAFGIAASRFRVFRRPIIAKVEKVVLITKGVIALHNYLMSQSNSYCPPTYVDQDGPSGVTDGEWRKSSSEIGGMVSVSQLGSHNYSKNAKLVKDNFKDYFNGEGAVDWQVELVTRTV